MRIIGSGSIAIVVLLAFVVTSFAQEIPSSSAQQALGPATVQSPAADAPAASAQSPEAPASSAVTLNDVLDRVVQREHLFMAQMRHMHPMVETYLQDLKNDSAGNPIPVNDKYFLGRLDMSDGLEDVSFVGQPGFGHRMLTKLTGVYSLQ